MSVYIDNEADIERGMYGEIISLKHAIQTAAYEECKKIAEKVSEVYTIEEVMGILKQL